MIGLANLAIRRPRAALVASIAAALVLAALGLGLDDRLSPTMTSKPGTESTRAAAVAEAEFGPSTLVPILLTGPPAQLDRQGPVLVRSLARRPDTRVLSAWDAGEAGSELRPSPRAAMVLASVAHSEQAMLDGVQAEIDATVDRVVRNDVRAHVTGQPTLDAAIQDEALDTARQATLLALPILFLALLILLRAPLAAAIGTAFGGTIAFASQGVLTPLAEPLSVDGIGVALTAVMGLALGTAFAVLMLTRFRAESEAGADVPGGPAFAATRSVAGTGRAVLIAGTGLFLSLLLAAILGPAENLRAIGAGTFVAALLATGAAVVTMPALLTLLGPRTFAGSFGAPALLSKPWGWLVRGERVVLRRALPVAAIGPFVASGLFNLRLTIGLAIAVLLDALIVRPVLLPAAIALFGEHAWWPSKPTGSHPPTAPSVQDERHLQVDTELGDGPVGGDLHLLLLDPGPRMRHPFFSRTRQVAMPRWT